MKKYYSILLIGSLLFGALTPMFFQSMAINNSSADLLSEKEDLNSINCEMQNVQQNLAEIDNLFIENQGQIKNESARFYTQGGGVWFLDDGVVFELREEVPIKSRESRVRSRESDEWFNPMRELESPEPMQYRSVVIKLKFLGANTVRPVGKDRLSWNNNYFYGNDSSKWCIEVPNYKEIIYENLYNNIDLRYYTTNKGLKYDFIVHPGGDPSDIRLKYEGARRILIDDSGNIRIMTPIGDFFDSEPFLYQNAKSERNIINGKFKIINFNTYCYEIIDKYDKTSDLIIDPLIYSTFLGGSFDDWNYHIAIDSNSNVFLAGCTESLNFPNTPGSFNNSPNIGFDVFVLKLNSLGSSLIYSTYIGGSCYDYGRNIVIDDSGNAYVTGYTNSSDFPYTANAFDTVFNGNYDCFLLKLNPLGSMLVYSTFIGGGKNDEGISITLDSLGNIYMTGSTWSTNFPNTTGAYDNKHNGVIDTFILKINSLGTSLIFSTYIGGSNEDRGFGIVIDSNYNIYVAGETYSSDFPNTTNAYDNIYNGGRSDVFVLKLNSVGSALIYSTYVGGSDMDYGGHITIDLNKNVYVTGQTESFDFPNTTRVVDKKYGGKRDGFLFKLNHNGSALIYSTFVGGTDWDYTGGIAIDKNNNNIYITGGTKSNEFPLSPDAEDDTYNGGKDVFVIKLNENCTKVLYSTFIGGSNDEEGQGLQIDSKNNIYVTGLTNSFNFPTTSKAYDPFYNNGYDAFVLKLNLSKNINYPSVLSLKLSKQRVFRTSTIRLYSNASDIEDLEQNLIPIVEYRDPNEITWNKSFILDQKYKNSNWKFDVTPSKNAILGLYDFRIMFIDSDLLFSSWYYLNDSLTVLNNNPLVENMLLSKDTAILGNKLSIWINGSDIEEPESNLTIELEYKQPYSQLWDNTYFEEIFYSKEKWIAIFNLTFDAPFGYYDFRLRFNDSDEDFSHWFYSNDSLFVYNLAPKVINIKLSENIVYRTHAVFLYVNGSDYETPEPMLKLFAQYKYDEQNNWYDLKGEYSKINNRWEIEFITDENSILGLYDFRVKFVDNSSISSGWFFLNDSLEALNNLPIVIDLYVSESDVFRTQFLIIKTNGMDIETLENLLICEVQYKSPIGKWQFLNDSYYVSDHWEINFTPLKNAELGFYDLRINFTDTDSGFSGWTLVENAFEVKNNLPVISNLCDDFVVNMTQKDFDLTKYESDIEDSGEDLIWDVDLATINTTLFTTGVTNPKDDILRIIPKENIIGSDDISLILIDKDGGISSKSNVTIFINSVFSCYYDVKINISPNHIEVFWGQYFNITLKICNLGDFSDNYTIDIESNNFPAQSIIIKEIFLSLNSKGSKEINVTIIIPFNIEIGTYKLTFKVKGDFASNNTDLLINVKEMDDVNIENNNNNLLFYTTISIILIMIILIIILFLFLFRKKGLPEKSKGNEIEIKDDSSQSQGSQES